MMKANEARALGFVVDDTCYPWLAYKGPRFSPTEKHEVLTDTESQLLEAVVKLKEHAEWMGTPAGYSFSDFKDTFDLADAAIEACKKPARMRPDPPKANRPSRITDEAIVRSTPPTE